MTDKATTVVGLWSFVISDFDSHFGLLRPHWASAVNTCNSLGVGRNKGLYSLSPYIQTASESCLLTFRFMLVAVRVWL